MAAGNEEIPIDEDIDGTSSEAAYLYDASHMSLTSSADHYRLENNRKYHTYRDGSYWVPHDKEAVELDTIAHHIFLLTFDDKLYLAPLRNPQNVIDVGTGNGIWAQNFAEKFPDAEIIGTDLARVQEDQFLPNLRFEIDDCCSDWIYPPDHFDYVHVRLLYGSIADWDTFYKECYEHLAPGGWIEQAEINPCTESDDDTKGEFFTAGGILAHECGRKAGKRMDVQSHIKEWITQAGFVDVVEETFKWPLGDWPADGRLKEIGRWNGTNWNLGIEAWSLRMLTQQMGWTVNQVKRWNEEMRGHIKSRKCHVYQPVSVVYGRKPL